jgi:hypothetical protein
MSGNYASVSKAEMTRWHLRLIPSRLPNQPDTISIPSPFAALAMLLSKVSSLQLVL